jgi:predicted nucleotidyltransferase
MDPERATEDTDVALAVRSWGDFRRLREALLPDNAIVSCRC